MTGAGLPPEWENVETKAQRVDDVDPGKINEVAEEFNTASQNTDDHTHALQNAATPLQEGGVWEGPAADSFFDYVERVASAGNSVKDKLGEVATELTSLQETLAAVKDKIENATAEARKTIDERNADAQKRADAAETAMQEYRNDERDSPPSPTADEIIDAAGTKNSATAQEAEAEIDDLLEQAGEALNRAQALMKTELADGFSTVAPPGSSGTSPASADGVTGDGTASEGVGGGAAGGGGGGAAGGAGGGDAMAGTGSSGPPPSGPPPGNVEQWIQEAITVLQDNGIPVTEENIDEIWTIIENESAGDPHAFNDWDSNAAKGTPSKGLMQTIAPTFDAHKLPGHDDIWDPVDNIVAGVRYTFDRYGGFDGHPGLQSMAGGGGYQGY